MPRGHAYTKSLRRIRGIKARYACKNCKRRHVRCVESSGKCERCEEKGLDCEKSEPFSECGKTESCSRLPYPNGYSSGRVREPSYLHYSPDSLETLRRSSGALCHLDTSPVRVRQLSENYFGLFQVSFPTISELQRNALFGDFTRRHDCQFDFPTTGNQCDERQSGWTFDAACVDTIVYLVLALGEIALYDKSLPGYDSRQTQITGPDPPTYGFQCELPGHTSSVPYTSECAAASRRLVSGSKTSFTTLTSDASSGFNSKIPPFVTADNDVGATSYFAVRESSYFKEAMRHLYEHNHTDCLLLAQAHLLVGLFLSRIGSVEQGSVWFTRAGNMLFNFLDHHNKLLSHSNGRQRRPSPREEHLWADELHIILTTISTCARLESIRFVGYNLPSSRLSQVSILPLPYSSRGSATKLQATEEQRSECPNLRYHLALTWVERQLHQLHGEYYGETGDILDPNALYHSISHHQKMLQCWRDTLPQDLGWNDRDPVLSDVRCAQLRAKYYETCFRMHLPFLECYLRIIRHIPCERSARAVAEKTYAEMVYKPRIEKHIRLLEAIASLDIHIIFDACVQCIQAATIGVVAYNDVSKCFTPLNNQDVAIVTFHMTMALCSAYKNQVLRSYISEETLIRLCKGVIRLLESLRSTHVFFWQARYRLERAQHWNVKQDDVELWTK